MIHGLRDHTGLWWSSIVSDQENDQNHGTTKQSRADIKIQSRVADRGGWDDHRNLREGSRIDRRFGLRFGREGRGFHRELIDGSCHLGCWIG